MAEDFVELGAEGLNKLVDKHYDTVYDKAADKIHRRKGESKRHYEERERSAGRDAESKVSRAGRHRNSLPSPERDRNYRGAAAGAAAGAGASRYADQDRDDSLERQSETSQRVVNQYQNERDDPVRPVDPYLDPRRRDSGRMSRANGYAQSERPRSQGRGRYDDDGDSDYDEHTGRKYNDGGRGYDERVERDYVPYSNGGGREIVETERYRGPPRAQDPRRLDAPRGLDAPYGATTGAMAPYRRSQNDVSEISRRSRSRGRRDRYERDDRDDSYSRSRSRSRSRSKSGIRGKIDETFDTSMQGLGVGLAGAVVGGLAGRQFGQKHRNRDILIGALVGGLGANAAETKYKDYKENKESSKYESRHERR